MTISGSGNVTSQFKNFLEAFASELLDSYTLTLADHCHSTQKEFNDPIWGTIVLFPLEVAVLDSPLFQRLRQIKQLGVAHWVFPSAVHSRFEHTLGVVNQIDRMIDAINSNPSTDENAKVGISTRRLLRFCGLCHDVGHGMMSHVTDNAVMNFYDVEDLLNDFADEFQIEVPKLSEVASYYLVGSPAFRRLLDTVIKSTEDNDLPTNALDLVQKAIVGNTIQNNSPLLQELVSGPFDADKLDYMTRDAKTTGVPVVTDVNRLIRKIRSVSVTEDKLPSEIAKSIDGGEKSYSIIGISASGASALDELILGRTLLFNKIYRHQKVRALEEMVSSLLKALNRIRNEHPSVLPFYYTDDELFSVNRTDLESLCDEDATEEQKICIECFLDIARRLKRRDAFVRAFAFAEVMPSDPYRSDNEQKIGLSRFCNDLGDPQECHKISAKIAKYTHDILIALEETELQEKYPEKSLTYYIRPSRPDASASSGDTPRAFLITDGGDVSKFSNRLENARGWADAYHLTRDTGYIFSPRELSEYVFLATERTLREDFGIRTPDSMYEYSKTNFRNVLLAKQRLKEAGFYKGCAPDILPMPDRLMKADIATRTDALVRKLGTYQGPDESGDAVRATRLTSKRIVDWLRQFDDDRLIEGALDTLEHVKIISRDETTAAIRQFMADNPNFADCSVCALGTPKDSSSIITYYAGDFQKEFGFRFCSLHDALRTDKPILFIDDCLGSGKQCVSIFESLLKKDPSTDLFEQRDIRLSDEEIDKLKQTELGFVFVTGWKDGEDHIVKKLPELSLSVSVSIGIYDSKLPHLFDEKVIKDSDAREAFIEECRKIGQSLIDDYSPDRPEEVRKQRILGYGNRAFLTIFPYNTPTHTLTCLWAPGEYNGLPWTPLFPRRKKT